MTLWNNISELYKSILTVIKDNSENLHEQRTINKQINHKKVPVSLTELMPARRTCMLLSLTESGLFKIKVIILLLIILLSSKYSTGQSKTQVFLYYKNHIYLNPKLNGYLIDSILFDTGTKGLILDSTYFFSSGLRYDSIKFTQLFGVGTGAKSVCHLVYGNFKITLGSVEHSYSSIRVANIRSIVQTEVKGIIGPELFDKKIIKINYRESTLTLIETLDDKSEYLELDTKRISGKLYVDLNLKSGIIPKTRRFKLLVDLGSRYAISLNNYDRTQSDNLSKLNILKSAGGFGGSVTYLADTGSVMAGNALIRDVPFRYFLKAQLLSADGLLGNDFLSKFILVIDQKRYKIYLSRKN